MKREEESKSDSWWRETDRVKRAESRDKEKVKKNEKERGYDRRNRENELTGWKEK